MSGLGMGRSKGAEEEREVMEGRGYKEEEEDGGRRTSSGERGVWPNAGVMGGAGYAMKVVMARKSRVRVDQLAKGD